MTGKLKTKGNVMLATKLDGLLSVGFNFASVSNVFSHQFPQFAKAKGGKAKL
jgi:glycerol-3-phosphate acyltransferase PlsY